MDSRSLTTATIQAGAAISCLVLCMVGVLGVWPLLWWTLLTVGSILYTLSMGRSWRIKLREHVKPLTRA